MSDLASGKLLLFMLVAEQSWLMSEHIRNYDLFDFFYVMSYLTARRIKTFIWIYSQNSSHFWRIFINKTRYNKICYILQYFLIQRLIKFEVKNSNLIIWKVSFTLATGVCGAGFPKPDKKTDRKTEQTDRYTGRLSLPWFLSPVRDQFPIIFRTGTDR
jgi:hypothetical protein